MKRKLIAVPIALGAIIAIASPALAHLSSGYYHFPINSELGYTTISYCFEGSSSTWPVGSWTRTREARDQINAYTPDTMNIFERACWSGIDIRFRYAPMGTTFQPQPDRSHSHPRQ